MALLDLNKKVTRDLPIIPIKDEKGNWKHNGLCPVALVGVDVIEQINTKGEFADIPQLVLQFHFEGVHGTNEPDRYYTMREKIIGTIEGEELAPRDTESVEKNIQEMWDRIKHVLDFTSKSPNYRDIAKISKKDQDKYFDLPATGDPKARVEKFNAFFTYIANFVNGDGEKTKSVLIGDDGKRLVTGWMKLLPAHPQYNYYARPTWVQTGFLEPAPVINAAAGTMKPAQIIRIGMNESLELRVAKKGAAVPGVPGAPDDVNTDTMAFLQGNG
jgi:hypothetical protein